LITQKHYQISLAMSLSAILVLSFFYISDAFFPKQHQQLQLQRIVYAQKVPPFNQSSANELSNMLLNQLKQIVFKHLSKNTLDNNPSNSTIPPVSMVLGIVSPNGTSIAAYGNLSNSNHTKVDGNTLFDIASITKTFATTVLMDMVNQGLVKLNDTLQQHLPPSVKVPSYHGQQITLKDLATHTSGLPDFPTGWIRNQSYTNQQVYDFLSNTTISYTPGTKANYSDIGMGILGHILSLKAGVPFEQLVKDKILNVLAMDDTGIGMNATSISLPNAIKDRFAKGHIGGKEVNHEFIPETIQAAGSMYSTANDLLKYLSANMGLIHTEINDAMEKTHLIRHLFAESSNHTTLSDTYIGLGWVITTDLGKEVIWHTGAIDGYSSIIAFNPEKQIGIVILCSCDTKDVPAPEMINFAVPFLLHYRTNN
jgi:serine-type D-Ala-D-Ala carboxypeptidase/endopeptidase